MIVQDEFSVRDFDFQNHVIFVLRSGSETDSRSDAVHSVDTDILGLSSFVSPLRASSLHQAELKDIIFYADIEALESEWKHLANFPKLYVYQVKGYTTVIITGVKLHRALIRFRFTLKQGCRDSF